MGAVGELKKLNFEKLLVLEHSDVANYRFEEYRQNNYRHPRIVGYCTECEQGGFATAIGEPEFSLKNMSHGAHATDFLAALTEEADVTGWHEEPVLFVYEAPSVDYGIYEPIQYRSVVKRPTKDWYWIHSDSAPTRFPDHFKGQTYGDFVLSAICTFRLKNAYVTNLVKCGLNTDDGKKFRGLKSFQPKCISTCVDRYLYREIEILQPRAVLAVGARVYNQLRETFDTLPLYQLPHPAGGQRGFKDSYFRVLYFWLIVLALRQERVIKEEEADELGRRFVRDYEEP